jgi:hypothetical protein
LIPQFFDWPARRPEERGCWGEIRRLTDLGFGAFHPRQNPALAKLKLMLYGICWATIRRMCVKLLQA